MLEIVVTANLRGFALPRRREFLHKYNIMGISHRNWRAVHLAKGCFDGKIVADLGLAHIHLKREAVRVTQSQFAAFKARACTYRQTVLRPLLDEISGNTARAVAGNFGFAAIG